MPRIDQGRMMNHSKRHSEILRLLNDEGTITIADLADKLGVSLETVRRDVKPLTADGSILKMHGAIGLQGIGDRRRGLCAWRCRSRQRGRAHRRDHGAGALAALVLEADGLEQLIGNHHRAGGLQCDLRGLR